MILYSLSCAVYHPRFVTEMFDHFTRIAHRTNANEYCIDEIVKNNTRFYRIPVCDLYSEDVTHEFLLLKIVPPTSKRIFYFLCNSGITAILTHSFSILLIN